MKKLYFPNLNGIRFIAAFIVMLYHFYGTQSIFNGPRAVILFFVLSGFLITYLLFEEKEKNKTISVKKFYVRRILRIWPLYFLVLFLASLLFFYNNNGLNEYTDIIFYYILFVPNLAFVIHSYIDYASILWSVGSEEQFYIIWPWLFKNNSPRFFYYLMILVIGLFVIVPHILDYVNNNYFDNIVWLHHTSLFIQSMSFQHMALGGVMAYFAKYRSNYLKYFFNKYLQVITFISIILFFHVSAGSFWMDQFYSILFSILIINLAVNPKVKFSLENKLFNYLGQISFGLYVYHKL